MDASFWPSVIAVVGWGLVITGSWLVLRPLATDRRLKRRAARMAERFDVVAGGKGVCRAVRR
jgi:hypothetical protein